MIEKLPKGDTVDTEELAGSKSGSKAQTILMLLKKVQEDMSAWTSAQGSNVAIY